MNRWLGKQSEWIYALMRIVVGLLFACHGAQKLFGLLGGEQRISDPLMLLGGIIEFGGGLMVGLGLRAGFAAFLASGMMAVGYFKAHAPRGFWPIVNKGELAVLYSFVFLYIASKGSGLLSIDALLGRKK
jgi:putative oxidoreductase